MQKRSLVTLPGRANGKDLRRALVLALSLLLLAVLGWLLREKLHSALAILRDQEQLAARARQMGPVAPLVLAVLLMLQVVIPMIPGQAIVLTIGYLYGPLAGSLLTATALFLSGQAAFGVARYAGRPIVYRLASPRALERWEQIAARQGILFYACVYTLPFMPSDLLVYVAGLGGLSMRRFTVANILGRLPMGIITTMLGFYQFKPPAVFWALPAVIILLALAGSFRSLLWPWLTEGRLGRPSSRLLNAGELDKMNYADPCN